MNRLGTPHRHEVHVGFFGLLVMAPIGVLGSDMRRYREKAGWLWLMTFASIYAISEPFGPFGRL